MDPREIKALWDDYRVSKAYGSSLDQVIANALYVSSSTGVELEYDLFEHSQHEKEPWPGSLYWTETLRPPLWFTEQVDDEDIVAVLKAASTVDKPIMKFKGRGKRRKERLFKKRSIPETELQ